MSSITLPTVPQSVRDHSTGPKTAAFGGHFLTLVEQNQAIVDKFAAIREIRSQLDSKLESGTSAEAVAYRAGKAKAAEKIASIRDDEKYAEAKAQIATLQEQIKTLQTSIDEDVKNRSQKFRDIVSQLKEAATKAEVGQVVTDVDPAALAKELTDSNEVLKGAVVMLLSENPELKGWKPLTPAAVLGNKAGDTRWTPRLSVATVNGTPVTATSGEHVTVADVAKAAGINEVDHMSKILEDSVGGSRTLPDGVHSFEYDLNGQTIAFTVTGRKNAKKATSTTTEADVQASTTDDAPAESNVIAVEFSGANA